MLDAGRGVEPQFPSSELGVLPLDEPAIITFHKLDRDEVLATSFPAWKAGTSLYMLIPDIKIGWGAWNRTTISGVKGRRPTIRRIPNIL